MIISTQFKARLVLVFRTNMAMRGYATAFADQELNFLMAGSLVTGTRDNYRMIRRIGAEGVLNRAKRDEIYSVFETSLNQVSFEIGE